VSIPLPVVCDVAWKGRNCFLPFEGMGKPEPLRHALAGYWSRRISDEHRMVYKALGQDLLIAQLRYHD